MTQHRLPVARCPACLSSLDAATNADRGESGRPDPGDLTVCGYCGAYLQFGHGLTLSLAPDDDATDLMASVRAMIRGRQN